MSVDFKDQVTRVQSKDRWFVFEFQSVVNDDDDDDESLFVDRSIRPITGNFWAILKQNKNI